MYTELEKKQLKIFALTAYALPFLFGLYMWYGVGQGYDLSVFPNAQMFYPAAGVILAFLVTRKQDALPRRFFVGYLVITALMVAGCVAGMFVHDPVLSTLIQVPILLGSIVCWVLLLTDKKENRERFGLRFKNWKSSALCILVFITLYIGRFVLSYAANGELQLLGEVFSSAATWLMIAALIPNFFIVFIAFFGEEYGWRYFLQPLLQKRFGLRWGVIILGVVWGLWHLPIDFFYYAVGYGWQAAVSQQITCLGLGIFFAWAYMKTGNIWVPVILHFLNNNLVPVISMNYSADVLENQVINWSDLPSALLINGLFFGSFLLSRVFRKKEPAAGEPEPSALSD